MAYTTINKSSDYFNTKLYTGNGVDIYMQLQVLDFNQILHGLNQELLLIIL